MDKIEETSVSYMDVPVCPKCGDRNEDWWDALKFNVADGTSWTRTCECGARLQITASVDINFDTEILKAESVENGGK